MTLPGQALPPRTPAGGTVVRLAMERLAQAGLDPGPLLRQSGLSDAATDNPDVGSEADSQVAFLNAAADALQDTSLGLHLAQDCDLRKLGLLFYLMNSSETVGEALRCFERFGSADDPSIYGSYRISDVAVTVALGHADAERQLDRQLSQFWLLTIYRLVLSFASEAVAPISVSFRQPEQDRSPAAQSYFPVPIDYNASEDRIDFEIQVSDMKLSTFDPYLHVYLTQYFEALVEATRWEPAILWSRVKKAMAPRLSHGTVTMANIAKDLGLSTRTLSRRLSYEGKTFSAILDELRAELAIHYIKIKGIPISEIAWHLGYREASAVVVAFRRWTGMSPSQLRRTHILRSVSSETLGHGDQTNGRLGERH
ncbi:AraC family transcriptional regulator [Methylobacterium gnaphalii]|uniref:AraC family transcriptional regulator n=1 Tax=Methylobacterium gnaphalii TaxID=1010610 RepID=A0A512JP21_9HYPH|nr:AraC family transcriptional regulator [Methylobacterium gnaphalii]GEP11613.1 AraC family transcriptional regulator [Methylobacterium gnaphalii]GJD69584.1 HTH-type transcriptional regulator VirS [Methylobacterium gnaphalii]GLS49124.1 AraC family transcriptional regulator [Methylobacterium gnaphalii]